MISFPDEPTQRLQVLIANIAGLHARMEPLLPSMRDEVKHLLEQGANPNAPAFNCKANLLDSLTHAPDIALLLLENGARLTPHGMTALQFELDKENRSALHQNSPHVSASRDFLVKIAQMQPDLDWYNRPTPQFMPWAISLEPLVPGLNLALETAQAGAGLYIGHQLTDRNERLAAIRHLMDDVPNPYIWVGHHDPVELLDKLMGSDIDANAKVELESGETLLQYLMGCSKLCQALIKRGALLGEAEMVAFLDLLDFKSTKEDVIDLLPDILNRMDQWQDLEHPEYSDRGTMLDVIKECAPEEFSAWQATRLDVNTPLASKRGCHLRL